MSVNKIINDSITFPESSIHPLRGGYPLWSAMGTCFLVPCSHQRAPLSQVDGHALHHRALGLHWCVHPCLIGMRREWAAPVKTSIEKKWLLEKVFEKAAHVGRPRGEKFSIFLLVRPPGPRVVYQLRSIT